MKNYKQIVEFFTIINTVDTNKNKLIVTGLKNDEIQTLTVQYKNIEVLQKVNVIVSSFIGIKN